MRRLGEILSLAALGAILCAFLFWVFFVILAAADGGNAGEAAFYGLIFAFGALAIGGLLGAVIAFARANALGGALLGAAGVALFVLLWTLSGVQDAGFERAFNRALPFLIYYSFPAVAAGLLLGWLRMRRERRRLSLTPG